MANQTMMTGQWGNVPQEVDETGMPVRPMSLKVQYTFDASSQERCLARWPQNLKLRYISLGEQLTIGVVDLRTCLQAVTQCSPELVGDNEKDYTIYAYDYSEPDTPLVGQGMLSRALDPGFDLPNAQPKLVTGRVTKNLLAIFGNGVSDTLEVKLKFTAVSKITRSNSAMLANPSREPTPIQRTSTPTPSENAEWNSFRQSQPNFPQLGGHTNPVTIAAAPVQSFHPGYEATSHEIIRPSSQGPQPNPGSRPTSAGLGAREPYGQVPVQSHGAPQQQYPVPSQLATASRPTKGGKAQSRPTSRASNRAPSGRPRGRPRKNPLPTEGNTSGYEDGTDADDGPSRKKRVTTTQAARSNTAAFGSTSDSLRVTASTSGSIRNFRPIAMAGDAPGVSHVQEVPRAPTPVPGPRQTGFPPSRTNASSSLRRESQPGPGLERSFTSSVPDLSQSACHGQDARSPTESNGVSPCPLYSDDASPAEITSSPPVPRSALYSAQSSPAPSSPILPPMPSTTRQPDSGYMSGRLDSSRVGKDGPSRGPGATSSKASKVTKPKARQSRAKKQQPNIQSDLIIHTETPGPPELLPQTSIYNPPHLSRKNSEAAKAQVVSDSLNALPSCQTPLETVERELAEEQHLDDVVLQEERLTPNEDGRAETALRAALLERSSPNLLETWLPSTQGEPLMNDETRPTTEMISNQVETPVGPQVRLDTSVEPDLPTVPASDPIIPRLTLPAPASEPAHPQTDILGPADRKSNKNSIKKAAIQAKLEEAISQGKAPQFCQNCGSIQTPTWRKVWKRQIQGDPKKDQESENFNQITLITVLETNAEGITTLYELFKKSLSPNDSKSEWAEVILCNPCGIWFSKNGQHRPSERWKKDEQRQSQTRKRKANDPTAPRPKKARTKSGSQPAPTSDAGLLTDPLGPLDETAPTGLSQGSRQPSAIGENWEIAGELGANCVGSTHSRGSSQSRDSRGSGSPTVAGEGLGATRRLLFPSPRKEGEQRILGEVAVNIVQTTPAFAAPKPSQESDKENTHRGSHENEETSFDDDFRDIFGTPPRPSTPPPKVTNGGPFKTPTRPTPGHRPVTRSVTRSIRSERFAHSPGNVPMMDGTPTRTPRSSATKRRSPNDLLPSHLLNGEYLDTPLSRSLRGLQPDPLSMMPSPSSYQLPMDFGNYQPMTRTGQGPAFDYSNFFSTDPPSSPPVGNQNQKLGFGRSLTYDDGSAEWDERMSALIQGVTESNAQTQ
ncbi:hypothetical protein M426DRAFT_8387 [Hypoxylon sp. CI-4A]|nr:hypothetical protein M426DRAFT_8387 [Hypoxylon sp. CI-4A]